MADGSVELNVIIPSYAEISKDPDDGLARDILEHLSNCVNPSYNCIASIIGEWVREGNLTFGISPPPTVNRKDIKNTVRTILKSHNTFTRGISIYTLETALVGLVTQIMTAEDKKGVLESFNEKFNVAKNGYEETDSH